MCGMRMLQEMKHCLVYSLGSQGDTSFEDEFLDRTICDVRPLHLLISSFLSAPSHMPSHGRL